MPTNLFEVIAVDKSNPFEIVEKPDIAVCGVNSTDDNMPIIVSAILNCSTVLSTPVLSVIVVDTAPVTPAPDVDCGPTNTKAEPL